MSALRSKPLRSKFAAFVLLGALVAVPAWASLKSGVDAPDFTLDASLAGKSFSFKLSDELKKGPVVVYFYPAAFTSGCTIEAHKFAEATEQFKAMGAQVIGVSGDDIDTLHKFGTSECGGKFAVASDPKLKVAKTYDAAPIYLMGHADRTSYVITPDDKVLYTFSSLSPNDHVTNTLSALKKWHDAQASAK